MAMDIIALVVAILGIITAIIVGGGQIHLAKKMKDFEIRQDERDERRRHDLICSESIKFIQKYSTSGYESEILLLPLCIVAYKYNRIYPYRREIYREFCSMTEEVQNEILRRQNIDLTLNKVGNYYSRLLQNLRNIIKQKFPSDRDVFYDNGKYFERAIINHGSKEVPNIRCAIDVDKQAAYASPFCASICKESDMDYVDHITNLFAYHADEKPISSLWMEPTSMGSPDSADEILPSYLCCIIAEHAASYSGHEPACENIGYVCDYNGVLYMEDIFLRALYELDIYS